MSVVKQQKLLLPATDTHESCLMEGKKPLTDTQWEVNDAQSNVQPEEQDHVGHFAKQEQVAYVLLQSDWERRRDTMNTTTTKQKGPCWYNSTGRHGRIYTMNKTFMGENITQF